MVKTDKNTTLAQVTDWFTETYKARGWDPSLRSMAISLVLEASELLEHFQWEEDDRVIKKVEADKQKREEIELEVGDVLNYLCKFADKFGIDLTVVAKKTVRKINEKYPAEEMKRDKYGKFYEERKRLYRLHRK